MADHLFLTNIFEDEEWEGHADVTDRRVGIGINVAEDISFGEVEGLEVCSHVLGREAAMADFRHDAAASPSVVVVIVGVVIVRACIVYDCLRADEDGVKVTEVDVPGHESCDEDQVEG